MNKLTLLCVILSITLTTCQHKPMEEKFDYTGTLSAPYEYPIQVVDGWLIADNYSQSLYLGGLNNAGWGNTGGIMAVGPDLKDVPHALEMTWRSFQENKWYTGRFDLPKAKMLALFKEGYINRGNGKKETYYYVIIGLAPQGNVIIWLDGAGPQIEVATFKAKEVDIKKEEYHKNVHYMFEEDYNDYILSSEEIMDKEVQARIAKRGGLPPMDTYINTYRKQYHWKPVVELPDGGTCNYIGYNRYNGETVIILNEKTNEINYVKKPVLISQIGVIWKDKLGQKYCIAVDFEIEKELVNTIAQFSQDEPIDFIFRISNTNTLEKLSIKSSEKEIELYQFEVTAYKKE